MNILIIEDEENAARRLRTLIQENLDDAHIIAIIDSVEDSIKWFKNNTHPDLTFLDIQLSDGLSFNIFKQVVVNSPIIFTTAYDKYALDAFEVNSIDYLLKPINEKKLKRSLDKYQKNKKVYSNSTNFNSVQLLKLINLKKDSKSRFLVKKGNCLVIIDINDISYFYSKDKSVHIVTFSNSIYPIKDTLDKIENDVEEKKMFRANRQVLISAKSIRKIHNHFNYKLKLELIPKPEFEVIVSRTKVTDFKEWISMG